MTDRSDIRVPRVSQDPTDPAFSADPYPFYRRIRELGEFVYWDEFEMVVATTHVAAADVLRNSKLGRMIPIDQRVPVPAGLEAFHELEEHSLLQLEPPEHTRLRRIAMEGFGRDRLAPLGPQISRIADSLIDAFPTGEIDLIEAFAKPLPGRVIANFLGLPEEMAAQLQDWSNDMVAMYQARRNHEIERKAAAASRAFASYVRDMIEDRRRTPGNGFLDSLIALETKKESMTTDELVSTVVLLLNAGHEATVHSLGNAIVLLTESPDRTVALEPPHIAFTVEECLRYDPPLHLFTRYVYAPVEIMGQKFVPGQQVGSLLGSACRDDSVWPDGDKFDPFRARRTHLAFGSGIHVCIGASLARLEMQIALPALFSRCPDLKITEPPQIANLYHFHGYERIMARVK